MRPLLHVLIVGRDNYVRSVLAEAILREKVYKAGLAKQFTVSSGGTDSLATAPPPKDVQVFARKHGYDLTGKMSGIITKQMIESADLVFCLDRSIHEYIARKYKLQAQKIFLFRQFDIAEKVNDPDIRDINENHDPAEVLEIYGKLKKEFNRMFEKLAAISKKKVHLAVEYNKRKHEHQ